MSATEFGAYMRLLLHSWNNGPLQVDEKRLRTVAKLSPYLWAKSREVILDKFEQNQDGMLINRKLERVRQEQVEYKRSAREAGKKGAAKRWEKNRDPNGHPNANPNGQTMASQALVIEAAPLLDTPPLPPPACGGGLSYGTASKKSALETVTAHNQADLVVQSVRIIWGDTPLADRDVENIQERLRDGMAPGDLVTAAQNAWDDADTRYLRNVFRDCDHVRRYRDQVQQAGKTPDVDRDRIRFWLFRKHRDNVANLNEAEIEALIDRELQSRNGGTT